MLIDWFTVGAQVLNFVILVWLMKRFLYKPVLHAIDTREKRIAAELADADAKKAEAQAERSEFRQKNERFDQQRATLLSQATDQAEAERRQLLDAAREAADELSIKRLETLRNDAQELSRAIGRQTREEVFSIARKALRDLAAASLEERMSEVFTQRLRELNSAAKARLNAAQMTASNPATVRSAFELPPQQRAAIQSALNEAFAAEIHVRFETASSLIGGIELATNGQKVAWSIDDYLKSLEESVSALVGKRVQPQLQSKPAPVPVLKGEANENSA